MADRDRVLTAALWARGVQVVLDDLAVRTVRGPGTSDAAVATQVLELMATMPSVHVEEVRIRVRRGVVTVGGAILWPFERDILLNLIGAVPGVVDVIDALVLRRTDRVPEAEAQEAVRTSGSSPHRG
jgi:osmotically-inducible protein OsmY